MGQGTFVHDGDAIDYTPGSAVASGDVIILDRVVGIATDDIAANALGALAVEGVFDVVKKQEAITVGAAIYWDDDGNPYGGTASSGAATATVSDALLGFAVAAAAETGSTVRVKINRAPLDLPT